MDKKVMSIVFPMEIYKKLEELAKAMGLSKVSCLRYLVVQTYKEYMKEK